MSVVQIEHAETMERGKPKPGGLSDPRLGTIDRKIKCETCMAGMAECPGHFGHLELAKPMFHIGFIKTVLSIMRCVCFNCSKILADEVLLALVVLQYVFISCYTWRGYDFNLSHGKLKLWEPSSSSLFYCAWLCSSLALFTMDRDELVEVSFWHVNCNYFYLSFIAPQPNLSLFFVL